jgi:hypothetical protein
MTIYTVKYSDGTSSVVTTATLAISYNANATPLTVTGYLHASKNVTDIEVDLQLTTAHAILEIGVASGDILRDHRSTVTVKGTPAVLSRLKWISNGNIAILDVEPHVDPVDLDLTGSGRTPKPVKVKITRPLIAN